MPDNEIHITGNLVREPELRFTTGGTATCGFGIAVNRRYQQNGEWVDAPTNFFNVTVWGQYGENVAASLSKGDRVLVKGRLDFRKYQNKEGVEVTTHDIIADEVCPSLKYATAQISRIERESTGSGARRGSGGGRRQQADPVYGDTEPFADLGAHRFEFRNMAAEP
jgi:single-strand DNA-binding protein